MRVRIDSRWLSVEAWTWSPLEREAWVASNGRYTAASSGILQRRRFGLPRREP